MKTTILITTDENVVALLQKLGLGTAMETIEPVKPVETPTQPPVAVKPPAETTAAPKPEPQAASKPPAESKPQQRRGGGGRRKSKDDAEFWSIEKDEKNNGRMALLLGMVSKNDKEMPVAVVEKTDSHYRLAFIAKTGKTAYANGVWNVKHGELQEEMPATIENALALKAIYG